MTTTDEQAEARSLERKRKEYPRFKRVLTWSREEKRLRLFRVLWMKGLGPGYGAPENYSAMLSVALEWKLEDLWVGAFWNGDRDECTLWLCILPCLPIRLHYKRAYGGWQV